jgi:hypothetical protein
MDVFSTQEANIRQPDGTGSCPKRILRRVLSLEPGRTEPSAADPLICIGRPKKGSGLRWKDLQATGEGGQITVFGKGGKTRSIQLPASAVEAARQCQTGGSGVPRRVSRL